MLLQHPRGSVNARAKDPGDIKASIKRAAAKRFAEDAIARSSRVGSSSSCGMQTLLDKLEGWKVAIEEGNWLRHYEREENCYNAGKVAEHHLERAKKAWVLVSKLP